MSRVVLLGRRLRRVDPQHRREEVRRRDHKLRPPRAGPGPRAKPGGGLSGGERLTPTTHPPPPHTTSTSHQHPRSCPHPSRSYSPNQVHTRPHIHTPSPPRDSRSGTHRCVRCLLGSLPPGEATENPDSDHCFPGSSRKGPETPRGFGSLSVGCIDPLGGEPVPRRGRGAAGTSCAPVTARRRGGILGHRFRGGGRAPGREWDAVEQTLGWGDCNRGMLICSWVKVLEGAGKGVAGGGRDRGRRAGRPEGFALGRLGVLRELGDEVRDAVPEQPEEQLPATASPLPLAHGQTHTSPMDQWHTPHTPAHTPTALHAHGHQAAVGFESVARLGNGKRGPFHWGGAAYMPPLLWDCQ